MLSKGKLESTLGTAKSSISSRPSDVIKSTSAINDEDENENEAELLGNRLNTDGD